MKMAAIFMFTLFCGSFLLAGCVSKVESAPAGGNVASSTGIEADKPSESRAVSKDLAATVVPSGLKEGMAYGDLRNIMIANKWLPKPHPDCKRGVIGADFEKVCSSSPNLCKECDDLPELGECSGDGHCLMEFSDLGGQQVLTVATYGDIRDAKVEGKNSGLRVSWWDTKPKK
jgi:hypothetical protein